jgi:hypothetical protein
MKKNWRWPAAGAIGLLVAVSLFVIPAFGEVTVAGEVGTLRLHMAGEDDLLIYERVAGGTETQELSQTGCKLSPVSGPLGVFSASNSGGRTPFPGLKDHRIGVGQNGEGNGEPCARINGDLGQVLVLQLGGALDGLGIAYAEIDLGFKFNGNAILELRNGGVEGPLVEAVPVDCNNASDCGPDSGGADNKRVVLFQDSDPLPPGENLQKVGIPGSFDTLVIRPGSATAAVSLEWGPAPRGPVGTELGIGDTIFKLVEAFEGEIDCTETETLVDGDEAIFEVTRGFDTHVDPETEAPACKGPADGLLFNYESGEDGDELFVDFITEPVDDDFDTVAQFLEVITWNFTSPPNVDAEPPNSQHKTLFYDDPEFDDYPVVGRRVMPWCKMDPRVGGQLPVPTLDDPVDTSLYLPDGHTSCLIDSHSFVTPDGDFIKEDVVYNIGDGKRWN